MHYTIKLFTFLFKGKQFLKEKSGNLICDACNAKTAPRCFKCNLIFAPGESYKKLNESTFYHNQCFNCCGPCRKPIAAEFYDMEDGKFICVECYDKYGSDYDKYSGASSDDVYNAPPPPLPTSAAPPTQNKFSRLEDPNNLIEDFNSKMNMAGSAQPPSRYNPYAESLPAVQREPQVRRPTPPRPEPEASINENICAKCGLSLVGTFTVYNEKKYQ